MAGRKKNLPLVYSCSRCSSAAQMANHVALRLDREGEAEMSCLAGVGGNVPHLVNIARSARPILALDGEMPLNLEAPFGPGGGRRDRTVWQRPSERLLEGALPVDALAIAGGDRERERDEADEPAT